MKILLLEDDIMLRNAITRFLTLQGHNVDAFKEGLLAQEAILANVYDLLLLDINVPKLNGLDLLSNLSEKKIQINTIFISAMIDIDYISRAFELGCYDYLKKPFHLKELQLRIDKLLHSSYVPQHHIRLSSHYHLDTLKEALLFKSQIQTLSERHLKIITLLANNRNHVVNYTLFETYAWEGKEVGIPTIRAEINRLKKTLKEDIIINVRNLGYLIKTPSS